MSEVKTNAADEAFCASCGSIIKQAAEICPHCGVRQQKSGGGSEFSQEWVIVFLLSVFLGYLGIDRFYVGKIGTGILKLVTGGGCGVWWLIDLILIATENFTDKDGVAIKRK
jgi:RNA polymerase subunit RPABC4/transcription elongation factor Spt4